MSEALAVLERHEAAGAQSPPSADDWQLLKCLLGPLLTGLQPGSSSKP